MTITAPFTDAWSDERIKVKNTQVTVPQLFEAVGDAVTARWETLGITDDKIQWQYGKEADDLIPEFPAGVVYKAIAIKTGKTSQTIRKCYYTYKAYTKEQREKYNLVPYAVFAHARLTDNKEEVLRHYLDKQSSVDEIENNFPVVEDVEIEKEFKAQNLDRIFYGVFREVFGLDSFLKARVMEHIKEIQTIIRTANK